LLDSLLQEIYFFCLKMQQHNILIIFLIPLGFLALVQMEDSSHHIVIPSA